ncbi:SusC/RagA family TonB-linked outer membrane protein [Bergeyella zoohelcum]|uniref:TonB-linked outer membrane protein, SusC/RagA family n=1 Tax=Bergeyella zoohelcum TaxID=1015 RepID=A0A376BZ15_9FLAO|nr:SusC/RagA family TonB-linked outer membrane protein [Bergeyella zoohelcum]EKB61180.1 SusC/RagA family TonB-linked outer membrane protein [Bergeyella zoohelcum CCUG 30536]SSZ46729.1 TonB-linked outer membrane protein, SusC/RagA family [Bergeyella zoohelcum]
MSVKSKVLSAGVLFFLGGQMMLAQKAKKDTLQEKKIEDVVVLGYVKRSVSNTTGSSQGIDSKAVENPAFTNAEAALQGQVAGVQAVSVSGAPGAVQDVRIRGVGSFTSANNRPLYVIDGVPVNDTNLSVGEAYTSMSPISSIPSQDIESFTVLKDASATAAYGARGSNGVIVITTKRGRSGKAKFSWSSSLGFSNEAYNKVQMLNAEERFMLLQESLVNRYGVSNAQALNIIVNNNIGNYNGWNANGRTSTNWGDVVRQKNALNHDHAFSVNGGNAGVRYYLSLNHSYTEPIVISKPYQRTSANVKIDATLTPKTKVETSVLLSKVDQDPVLENGFYFGNPMLTRYFMTPWYNGVDASGTAVLGGVEDFTSIYNTLYVHQNDIRHSRVLRSFVTMKVEHKLFKDLTLANNFSVDYLFRDRKQFQNKYHGQGVSTEGYSYRGHRQNVNFVNQLSLNWVKRLEKHRFDLLGLFEYQKNTNDYLSGEGEKFPVDGLYNLASASTNFSASSSYNDFVNSALLGMFNYSYDRKLILDATFRREGSSKFAPGRRYGNFWSVGTAYNLHRDILQDVFNEFKIRASYGTTGNSNIEINKYQSLLKYDVRYGEQLGAYPANYANSNLTWEKNKTFDVGVDFSVFNRRLSGTVAYFNKLTHDLLQTVPLSRTTGFNQRLMNVGDMRNTGVEISLSYDIIKKDNVNWNVYANFSTLKNEIVKLAKDSYGQDLILYPGSNTRGGEVGTSIGYWNLRKWAGVDPQTGVPLWYVNGESGDKTSDWNSAKQAFQGVSIPKFQGGFGTRLDIGAVFVNALFTFQGGHKIYDTTAAFINRTQGTPFTTFNGSTLLLDRWQKPGDQTDVPKLVHGVNNNFHNASTRWLYDGDYVRLRNIQVGYSLSSEWLKQIGITGFVLQVSGTNLLTWVKDKNLKFDPETAASGEISLTTPPVKTIMMGVKFNF